MKMLAVWVVGKLSQVCISQTELPKHSWVSMGQLLLHEHVEKEEAGGAEGSWTANH